MLNQSTILGLLLILGASCIGALVWFRARSAAPAGGGSVRNLRELTNEYRERAIGQEDSDSVDEDLGSLDDETRLTEQGLFGASLQDRLRYAQLEHVPLYVVSLAQVVISLVFFLIARRYFHFPLQALSLFMGPMFVNVYLERRIRNRVKRFDIDFPQFLLSVVGMLKTGLNTVQALEAAAENLEEESLVRQEVELMLERFRVGVPEDRSIGSFGEDIAQPEIELFVQALILSRRVGGKLSETLDRMAKQVRKRHAFKLSASASVAQQRGSIWVIVAIMVAVQLYLWKMAPQMVVGAWTHPSLAAWAQASIVLVWLGVLWMRKITNIKI